MEDFPTKVADLLETIAGRVRALTVDRVANIAKWTALGLVLAMLGFVAVVFLLVGIFRILGELIGFTTAYAVLGGLLVVAGALLWAKRMPPKPTSEV